MTRTFEDFEAVREQVPLIIGLVGATGSGKTGSALELATGFQDVQGGGIAVIDTEAGRAKAYAGLETFSDKSRKFKFRHLDFKAPFGPHDYIAACKHYVDKGYKHIVIDSASHMWEGTGGVLQMHDAEVTRLAVAWNKPEKDVNFPAWNKAKTAQTDFVNWMKQQPVNFLFCFRAKEKMKVINNKPVEVGWQAIGGEDLLYEMGLACLLLPECDGKPIWNKADEKGVKALHAEYRPMFADNPRLSIAVGRKLAEFGKGVTPQGMTPLPTAQPEPAQAPNPRPQETPGQRLVKCMALLDSATSTADLKAKGATFKDETPENRNQLAAHYKARFRELKDAGK